MQRLFAALLALTCVFASTASFARGGMGRGFGGGMRYPGVLDKAPAPAPTFHSRIPAPLPAPSQPPVINGPLSQPAFQGLSRYGGQ